MPPIVPPFQGVFFRKNTKLFADELGLSGWVRRGKLRCRVSHTKRQALLPHVQVQNTAHKTVIGEVVGSAESVESMKDWLENVGSKRSVIERAEFSEPEPATAPPAASFVIKR